MKTSAYCELFADFGAELVERVRVNHQENGGISRFEKIPVYLRWAECDVDGNMIESYCEIFSRLVKQAVIDAPWVPGVYKYLLNKYRERHFALVTATPQYEIAQILSALKVGQCFREVYGAPIEKADAIRSALKNIAKPCTALMIGDAETDLLAAKSNAMSFLLRRTSHNRDLQDRYNGLQFDDLNYE